MSLITGAKVIRQERVAPGCCRLYLEAPQVALAARPGQFLHVRCGETLDPLLRRPVSIHSVDRENGEVSLLYRVVGKGTAMLSEKREGDLVSLLGPLGHGFSTPQSSERISVVAGGLGIAPLYFLLRELSSLKFNAVVFLGSSTNEQLLCVEEIKGLGHKLFMATDDGSAGFHGTVVELFDLYTSIPADGCGSKGKDAGKAKPGKDLPFDRVYGCGPAGMLKELCEVIRQTDIPGEVSLEERMGCGVGACLSCVCKTSDGKKGFLYRRTCVEGPVFPAGEVLWD